MVIQLYYGGVRHGAMIPMELSVIGSLIQMIPTKKTPYPLLSKVGGLITYLHLQLSFRQRHRL